MGVLIIGALSLTVLVWGLITSLANEADAEKRRLAQRRLREDGSDDRAGASESLLAA
ncbi:MAG: hypothetical protein K1X60_12440 [Nitrospira sp.]|nr:hypothetical protein [Nitrospira sp.]MCW5796146.1 hypothetical protein [Nitrospira sp.]HMV58816.1 hypothetical protein [Nitrospira sp.]HMW88177.1 hypothetical protein [Nitrospira sp.]HMZ96804.1 hypothetical protein [Nitrospira sp.]